MPALFSSLALAAVLASTALFMPPADDLDAVMVPLERYLQGQAEGDGSFMRQAFHPDATVSWTQDGAVAQRTAEAFAALFTRGPASDEDDRRRRVVSVDITGDVAVAKIELDYPGAFLTDYMTLIRVADEWKIIGKAYTRGPARSH